MSLVRGSIGILVAGLALAGGACVSPDTFFRDVDGGPGLGGGPGNNGQGGSGPSGQGGAGPSGQGGSNTGQGGSNVGTGGRTGQGGATGLGGRTGMGGATAGTVSLTDDFETGDVNMRWLWPQSTDSTPCGTWAVVAEGTNHVYKQTSTACTSSNASWAAGGSTDWTDMRLQARVRWDSTSTGTITIAVRYNTPKDLYWIEFLSTGDIKIRSRNPSSTTDVVRIASNLRVAVPVGQWTTLGLSISGSTISAYLGDNRAAAPVATGTASGQVKGGIAIGVANGTASFDDILVTPP